MKVKAQIHVEVYIDDGKGLQNMVELRIQEQARAYKYSLCDQ